MVYKKKLLSGLIIWSTKSPLDLIVCDETRQIIRTTWRLSATTITITSGIMLVDFKHFVKYPKIHEEHLSLKDKSARSRIREL